MQQSLKNIVDIYNHGGTYWVGDGFHVRNFFPSNDLDQQLSPFILLDYAGPTQFKPTKKPHGVGEHPHRGFETVTLVYQGNVSHRDSAGHAGTIGPGDVQWMTAASGVVHEEMHEQNFAEQGGLLEMIQLWVNLPAASKMSKPKYQTLIKQQIPVINLANSGSFLRIIAGHYQNTMGLASTFTPVNLFDGYLKPGSPFELKLPEAYHTAIFVLDGELKINEAEIVAGPKLVLFEPQGEKIILEALIPTRFLVLNGEPILEPVVRHGPFVMNTVQELEQAITDYKQGKMGHLS